MAGDCILMVRNSCAALKNGEKHEIKSSGIPEFFDALIYSPSLSESMLIGVFQM